MVANKKIINSTEISRLFGLNSKIFKFFYDFIELQKNRQLSEFQHRFSSWKSIFDKIYGSESNEELFLKHSYLIVLLRTIASIKVELFIEEASKKTREDYINLIFQPEAQIFFCPEISNNLQNELIRLLSETIFVNEDLFQGLYQQIFFIFTRHKLGEYYTPAVLVKKMVKDTYKVGFKVLDPSCGSGSFIVEIINSILNSKSSEISKLEAIENIYGFDINPLATITAKVNTLLLIGNLYYRLEKCPKIHIYNLDGLFPEKSKNIMDRELKSLYHTFDLIIGNPPWLTYKDLIDKEYQLRIRTLSEHLKIKPPSQYITHIEIGAIFFYTTAKTFLRLNGVIFFVITKSVLNGDHCYKFRAFRIFNNLEIWDFPENQFFNIQHICLKAEFIGENVASTINNKYPIKTKIIDNNFEVSGNTNYSSIKIEELGARIILPERELAIISSLSDSPYKKLFFQGATLVPKPLVFFRVEKKQDNILMISSDPEILKRTKDKWYFEFKNEKIEPKFAYKSFLNKDMVPFCIKRFRNIFLPVDVNLTFNKDYLIKNPLALTFYNKIDEFYRKNKKRTSKLDTLFSNLNYWNKLTKQINFKSYNIVYNASGSSLKALIIDNTQNLTLISSENYYYSTNSLNEASYLCAILNSPILTKYIKLIKSSRHIHKRPFSFPIPLFNKDDILHDKLAKKGLKYHSVVQDLVVNNPNISPEKVRIFIHQKLSKLNSLTKQVVFNI